MGKVLMMKTIELTQGKVTIVDDEDFEIINGYPWYVVNQKNHWYAVYATGTAQNRVSHRMHTIIMNPPHGYCIDHIDGDGLNNIRANLRIVLPNQNAKNRRKLKTNTTSRFKGVNWFPLDGGKWLARIQVNKRAICIGYFKDEEEAARAYDDAALKYHGEFACLNFSQK